MCDWSAAELSVRTNLFDEAREVLEATAEALSQALQVSPDTMTMDTRSRVVNLTALCDTRCGHVFDIVENDLLGQLQGETAHIAAYRPRGVQHIKQVQHRIMQLGAARAPPAGRRLEGAAAAAAAQAPGGRKRRHAEGVADSGGVAAMST
jgi:hypothetical protein